MMPQMRAAVAAPSFAQNLSFAPAHLAMAIDERAPDIEPGRTKVPAD
jgi:hypothetical protein